jgi:type I restriction enzyme S subunit
MKIVEEILPAGWVDLTLENVAEIHDNLREPVNSSERAKRPGSYPYYGATGQVGWIDEYRQDGEYVLLGEDGAPFFEPTKEKAYLVSGKCWVNNHAHVLKGRENLCLNRYLLYSLNQTNYRGYANGTTRLKLTQSAMRQLPINLAPLNEQHRIVAKIEELFSELDKGIENLKTAKAQLKVYRQALLKHAFEGKLTAQWRAENQDKLETADALLKRIQQERVQRYQQQLVGWEATGGSKPKAPKVLPPLTAEELTELPELPDGWGWEKLGNIADLIGGVTKGKNLEGKEKLSLPYLRVANVQDGYLDLTEIKNIEVQTQDKDKYRLEFGDVLYTEGGDKDKLGRGAVWRGQIKSCIHQNHIFRARVFDGAISPEILSLYSQTKSAKKYFFQHAKQTTNLASINLTVLAKLPVVIVCQDEQKQILQEIEARLSEVAQLEITLTTALQQAEALRQSILKKAFSGQLVPQDSHDEPTSVLLARIKANKAKEITPRKTAK